MREPTQEEARTMVRAARALVGVPFQHAGRNMHGLDCLGVLVLAAHMCGHDVYDNADYSMIVDPMYMRSELSKACRALPDDEPAREGDVHLFRIGRQPVHVALVTEVEGGTPAMMLHAHASIGEVIEHPYNGEWAARFCCAFRLELS